METQHQSNNLSRIQNRTAIQPAKPDVNSDTADFRNLSVPSLEANIARNSSEATASSSTIKQAEPSRDLITGMHEKLPGMNVFQVAFYRTKELYFCPNKLESQKLYKILGVTLFKDLLMSTIGRTSIIQPSKKKTGTNYHLSDGTMKDLLRFDKMTRMNESIHVVGAVHIAVSMSQAADISLYSVALLVLNSYCVMLQRYNRIRLHKAQRNKYLDDQVDNSGRKAT